jgi:hypothetical protein
LFDPYYWFTKNIHFLALIQTSNSLKCWECEKCPVKFGSEVIEKECSVARTAATTTIAATPDPNGRKKTAAGESSWRCFVRYFFQKL